MAFMDENSHRQSQPRFLDLSVLKPQTKDEVKSALFKLSEMKLKPEIIPDEDPETIFNCTSRVQDQVDFSDPVPVGMREVILRELSCIDIDWKMLTLARPQTKVELDFFDKLIVYDKLTLRSKITQVAKEQHLSSHSESALGVRSSHTFDGGDEFTYDFFSRCYQSDDQEPAADEVQKIPIADDKNKSKNNVETSDANQNNLKPELIPKNLTLAKKKRRKGFKKLRKKKKRRKNSKKVTKKIGVKCKKVKGKKLKKVVKKRRIPGSKLKVKKRKVKKLIKIVKKKKKRIVSKKTIENSESVGAAKPKPVIRLKRRLKKRSELKTQVQMLPKSSAEEN